MLDKMNSILNNKIKINILILKLKYYNIKIIT